MPPEDLAGWKGLHSITLRSFLCLARAPVLPCRLTSGWLPLAIHAQLQPGFATPQYPTLRPSLDFTSAYSARSGESRCARLTLCLGLNLSNHTRTAVYPSMPRESTMMGNFCGIGSEPRSYHIDRVFHLCYNVLI